MTKRIKKKNYQPLFPNYELSDEEKEWCLNFEEHFDFEPIGSDEVYNPRDFLRMADRSMTTATECHNDMISICEHKMQRLSYYNDLIYTYSSK